MSERGRGFEYDPYLPYLRRENSRELNKGGVEDGAEKENSSWLSGIINPAKLEEIRRYPAYEGHSDEWIIMESLLANLVEKGPEMDPVIKARLHNLVGVLRMAFYPNMTEEEQRFMYNLMTQTTTVDFARLSYTVTPETREDIQWIWSTFGLTIPLEDKIQALPEQISQAINRLGLLPRPGVE